MDFVRQKQAREREERDSERQRVKDEREEERERARGELEFKREIAKKEQEIEHRRALEILTSKREGESLWMCMLVYLLILLKIMMG